MQTSSDLAPPLEPIEFIIPQTEAESHRLLPLIRAAHKENTIFDLAYDENDYKDIMEKARNSPLDHGCFYILLRGTPACYMIFMQQPLMCSSKQFITSMHSAYIRHDLRNTELGHEIWQHAINLVRAWSKQRGSNGIMFNYTMGIAPDDFDAMTRIHRAAYLGGNYFLRSGAPR